MSHSSNVICNYSASDVSKLVQKDINDNKDLQNSIYIAKGERIYHIYSYHGENMFGMVGTPPDWISKSFEHSIYTESTLPLFSSTLYAIDLKEDCTPSYHVIVKKRIQTIMSEHYIFFFHKKHAYVFIKSFSDVYFAIKKKEDMEDPDILWKIVDGKEIRRMIFQENFLFYQYSFSVFPNESLLSAFLNTEQANMEINRISKNFTYSIYVDGSYSPVKHLYAWAFVVYKNKSRKEIYFDKGTEYKPCYESHGSNVGEFLSMYHAHQYLLQNHLNSVAIFYDNCYNYDMMIKEKLDKFLLQASSKVFRELVTKYYEAMLPLQMQILAKGMDIQYFHSKGHAGIVGNERADFLANKAIRDYGSIF